MIDDVVCDIVDDIIDDIVHVFQTMPKQTSCHYNLLTNFADTHLAAAEMHGELTDLRTRFVTLRDISVTCRYADLESVTDTHVRCGKEQQ